MSEAQLNAVTDKLMGIDLSTYSLKMLTVSTYMIPESTAAAFQRRSFPIWVVPWGDIGWVIPLGLIYSNLTRACFQEHEALLNLMQFAESRGYDILRLRAGDELLPRECGLPTFRW